MSKLMKTMVLAALSVGLFGTTLPAVEAKGPDRILLSDVKALTLRQGKQTRGRRSTVPQLECLSGPCHETPKVVQCRNVGSDGSVMKSFHCFFRLRFGFLCQVSNDVAILYH